jgi:hypothetical protein
MGDGWVVVAFLDGSLGHPTFMAYAVCAPKELLSKVRYPSDSMTVERGEVRTIWPSCKEDERAIGGGFDFLHNHNYPPDDPLRYAPWFVRTERGADERSWGYGAYNYTDARTIIAYAVCAPAGALKTVDYKSASNQVYGSVGIRPQGARRARTYSRGAPGYGTRTFLVAMFHMASGSITSQTPLRTEARITGTQR